MADTPDTPGPVPQAPPPPFEQRAPIMEPPKEGE